MLRTITNSVLAFGVLVSFSAGLMAQQAKAPTDQEVPLAQQGRNDLNPARQQELREGPAWQAFIQNHPEWNALFNEQTGLPHKAYGPPISIKGTSIKKRAHNALNKLMAPFNLDQQQLALVNTRQGPRFSYATFEQRFQGKPVVTSDVSLRFTKEGALTQFTLDYYPDIPTGLPEATLANQALAQAARADLVGNVTATNVKQGVKVLSNRGTFRPVREVMVEGNKPNNGMPFYYRTLVDAEKGAVLYRANRIHQADFTEGPVQATVVDQYPAKGDTTLNLRYLAVTLSNQSQPTYTDSNGMLNVQAGHNSDATIRLEGRYASVQDRGDQPPQVTTTLDSNQVDTISLNQVAGLDQRSAYYHTNEAHDFMKRIMPNFTELDNPLTVNTGIEQGRGCNAFYSPSSESINFYADNDQCPSFAKVDDIVYHEYGHAISWQFYRSQGIFFRNGGLGEAFSDLWAMGLTDDPVVGKGANIGGRQDFIRRYDRDPKVYPEDLTGQVHDNGEILAGAFWDMRKNLGSLEQMNALFSATYYALPNAMEGNEGELFRDILIDVLTANDDDNNLTNGTPDDDAITRAFARHGISLLAGLDFSHQPKARRIAGKPATFRAELEGQLIRPIGEIRLNYSFSDELQWRSTTMSSAGSDMVYETTFPETDTGNLIAYYFEVYDQNGNKAATYPNQASEDLLRDLPYYSLFGYAVIEHDQLNNNDGWTVKGSARNGGWEVTDPVGSYLQGEPRTLENAVQPGTDHTDGTVNSCAVTENAPGETLAQGFADIDNGRTILISPYFSTDTLQNPVLGYHRWFSNATGDVNPGNDPFEVYIQSRDADRWRRVSRTFKQDREWRQRLIDVHEAIGTGAEAVRLRFIASDNVITEERNQGQSLTEAAIDDLVLYERLRAGVQATGVENPAARNNLTVYPNPTAGQVRMEWNTDQGPSAAQLLNAQGQVVQQLTLTGNTTAIDLARAGNGKGLYILRWVADGQAKTRKILYK